jgi:hypothetical protein
VGPRLADTIRAVVTVCWIRDDIRSTECSVQHDVAGSYIVDESIVMSLQCLYVVYSDRHGPSHSEILSTG